MTFGLRGLGPRFVVAVLAATSMAGCLGSDPFLPCDPGAAAQGSPEVLVWQVPRADAHVPDEERQRWSNPQSSARLTWAWGEGERDAPQRHGSAREPPLVTVQDCAGAEVARVELDAREGSSATAPGRPGWWTVALRIGGPHPGLDLTVAPRGS